MTPDHHALSVRFRNERGQEVGADIRIQLDASRAGTSRLSDYLPPVRADGNRASPGRLTHRLSPARGDHPGIGEEIGAGKEGRVVDGWTGKIADLGCAGEIGQRAGVAGHVAHRGDAAQKCAAKPGLNPRTGVVRRGIGGEMDVRIDQSGDDVPPAEIGGWNRLRNRLRPIGEDVGNPAIADEDGHPWSRG